MNGLHFNKNQSCKYKIVNEQLIFNVKGENVAWRDVRYNNINYSNILTIFTQICLIHYSV